MKQQAPSYCEHFQFLKIAGTLFLDDAAACKYCFYGTHLWLCLSKNCGIYVCAKNNFQHLTFHLQESRKNKKFHSIFINPHTTQIRCVQCHIEIGDLDIPSNQPHKNKKDPYPYRVKLIPGLAELTTHKIIGQLQNSEGHRKISRGLVGIFSNKYNYSLNAALQFIAHCGFFSTILQNLRVSATYPILNEMREIVKQIHSGQYRAIYSDVPISRNRQTISELIYKEIPRLLGYHRKDPFEMVLYLLGLLDEATVNYSSAATNEEQDEWDLFYRKNMLTAHHLIYSSIQATLSLNYFCSKCQRSTSVPHNIQFLKLNIPKRKRRVKEVQKELAVHRCDSPLKNRRKSLINLFKQQQCPITIVQLIIELMKAPLHRQMFCTSCQEPLKKLKLHFQKLPDILIIQIARFAKDSGALDQTWVDLATNSLDLGSFSATPDEEIMYDFQSAVCIDKGCFFPLVTIGSHNQQKYVIRHQMVQLCKTNLNPYLLCYRKRPSQTARLKLVQIRDDLSNLTRKKQYRLPDFWYIQLQYGIERPFHNQFVCKHNYLKPQIESQLDSVTLVSQDVYEDLFHFYQPGRKNSISQPNLENSISGSLNHFRRGNLYENQQCQTCLQQLQELSIRRKKERQYVLQFDKLKSEALPYCMIASGWIKKWSNYLYNKDRFGYMPKGYPMPPPIDNKSLLQGNKCKSNLVKNQDYKVLNLALWKLLKQLYGGGPEIRYRWREGSEHLEASLMTEIKTKAAELKDIYSNNFCESPKKINSSLSFIKQSSSFCQNESPTTIHQQEGQQQTEREQ